MCSAYNYSYVDLACVQCSYIINYNEDVQCSILHIIFYLQFLFTFCYNLSYFLLCSRGKICRMYTSFFFSAHYAVRLQVFKADAGGLLLASG